ncbi:MULTISPECIES: hypothetical protein [Sphingomonas]|jgi:hypothetical protein|uniref:hypothetical protein n=1 Tax=Sphingomonas TaxID=13687 RepID=UPI001AE43EB4
MSDLTADAIKLQAAMEQLRQERQTFDQGFEHQERWFKLRIIMGYAAVVLLPLIAIFCCYVISNPKSYNENTVMVAMGALFTDVLGLLVSIWKLVVNPASIGKLSPVTSAPSLTSNHQHRLPGVDQ